MLRIALLTIKKKPNNYILNLEESKIQGDFQNFPLYCFLHSMSKLKYLVRKNDLGDLNNTWIESHLKLGASLDYNSGECIIPNSTVILFPLIFCYTRLMFI